MADLSSSKFGKGVEELSSSSLGDGTRANAMHESETKRRRVSGGTQEAPPSGLGEIEEAPVFYPTAEEFKDPIKYISSIKATAVHFGICRIVPPEGWQNPTQVDYESKKKFATKLQRMSLMQDGRAMGDGHFYDVRQYEEMANEFHRKWIEDHYEDPSTVTFRDIEEDYWRLIKKSSQESVQVEYGNDLSTHEYWSGFLQRLPTDPPLGSTRAPFGSEEYYRCNGWNLNNISSWPGSAIRCITHSIDGINKPWLYLGMLFSSFCWHREDIYLASINYNHSGAAKQWYGVPGSKAKDFVSVMGQLMTQRMKEVPDLEHHITTQMAPEALLKRQVPVYKTRQEAGQFVVTFPEAYHCGFSYGFNCGEAVNFATSDWIPHGSQSVVDYRVKGKKEVFSFDRLLFTLSYHLSDLSIESCKMLLRELEVLQADETHFRAELYRSGVRDVTKIAQLPHEGRMSSEIPEALAAYDDQRICGTCQHTCFLSAVCCSCSEHKVSCPKCCDFMCGCPRKNKYVLEWHCISEIKRVVELTRTHIAEHEKKVS
mmetsp:Transcript_32656/g.73723  ORF Transcript_32656/g.73723 Transcript_32656/m.73723 type:complete len:541 (+) Transcript_32656:516-2138(+)